MSYRFASGRVTTRSMNSHFPGRCSECGLNFPAGEPILFTVYPSGQKVVKHATRAQCDAAKAQAAVSVAKEVKSNLTLDLTSIVDFLKAAQARGLKSPKMRVLGLDGRSEIRLSLTRAGAAPGSLAVVSNGEYLGGVRPNGIVTGKLSVHTELQSHLLGIAQEPTVAAKQYAVFMSLCSFCGKPLTDEGSVEVGYGPVCAKHWGLPHTPKGAPVIVQQAYRGQSTAPAQPRLEEAK